MSTDALETKKQQTEDYFTYHPDSLTVSIVGSSTTFPALFDHSYDVSYRDTGHVGMRNKKPLITFYSGHYDLLSAGVTQITIGDDTTQYLIQETHRDETGGTFQAEAWLV